MSPACSKETLPVPLPVLTKPKPPWTSPPYLPVSLWPSVSPQSKQNRNKKNKIIIPKLMSAVHGLSATGKSYGVPCIISLTHPEMEQKPVRYRPLACPLLFYLPPSSCPGQTRGLLISRTVVRSSGYGGGKAALQARCWSLPTQQRRGELAAALCPSPAPASLVVCYCHDLSPLTPLQGLTSCWCSPHRNAQR